ncbi:MAG: nodulation protein NfeD [Thermodesulfobacteriota bacterium]
MRTSRWFLLFFLFAIFSFTSIKPTGLAAAGPGEVYYVKAEGIINPVMAEYLIKHLREAAKEKAEAFIIELDTPGGLDLSMRDIIKEMLSSEVPVVVYVAPAGSRAASAGVFITYAADIAAMAPGTNIGSAHPVAMGGGKMDEEMKKKVENDSVAYIRGIAAKRGRNADWAEQAVRKSVNITAGEALKKKVINIVAADRDELIGKLDGRKVELAFGERVLHTKGARVKEVEMNWRFRILSAISNPNVAYILMMVGLLGIYFELSNPGAVFPGVIGALCLVLAFYSFQTLPVNYAGLILIALAVIFFVMEVWVISYGLLTIAGIISLILGSTMLFESPLPFMQLSIWVILPTVALMTAFILWAMYYAVSLYRRKPVSGSEQFIGETGVADGDLAPGVGGTISIGGEYWMAVSDVPVRKGEKVRVVKVKGLLLEVTRAEQP